MVDLSSVLLHPRFSAVQFKSDGSLKVRPVDHLSWSSCRGRKQESVNGHTAALEKLGNECIDTLASVLEAFKENVGCVPGLWKADINSAFRRIPVRPEHRWAVHAQLRLNSPRPSARG